MARLNVIGHPDGVCAGALAVVGAILCLVLIRPKDFVEHGAPA